MLRVPLHLRQKLNREMSGLACYLDHQIEKRIGWHDCVDICEVTTRYVIVRVDGQPLRINYRDKHDASRLKSTRENWDKIDHTIPWSWDIK